MTEGVEYGINIEDGGVWELVGTPTTSYDGFTTSVKVEQHITGSYARLIAKTTWQQDSGIDGEVKITADITDWKQEREAGNWLALQIEGTYGDTGSPLFRDIAINGGYAFLTSELESGLYVINISETDAPYRASPGITLNGAEGYQLVADGTELYVLTSDTSAELHVYNISNPEAISVLTTVDVPGDGKARSLAIFGDVLFIGLQYTPVGALGEADEIYAYDIESSAAITLLDSLEDEGSYNDIALHNGYGYTANSYIVSELRIADVYDPEDLVLAPGAGYNLTGSVPASSIAIVGDRILMGRNVGDINELILLDISSSYMPSQKWTCDVGDSLDGGTVRGVAVEPGGTYGFSASDHEDQELAVWELEEIAQNNCNSVAYYDIGSLGTGIGRAVSYDALRDRLFFATNSAFYIFEPGP